MGVGVGVGKALGGQPKETGESPPWAQAQDTAIQARGPQSWHHTLENADACLKISSAESASSSPRS